ncbi:MAG TPA: hypothetical protein VFT82_02635, partial [Candidatus Paceibacterota bacterium]|nr:hypothetical protein [Candidatus Paceibacterota bacterium]
TEALTLAAAILMNFAKLHVKVALVQAGCATQPIFVLVFAIILSKSHPHVFSEEMNGQAIWKKTMCIAVVVIGGAILSYTTA